MNSYYGPQNSHYGQPNTYYAPATPAPVRPAAEVRPDAGRPAELRFGHEDGRRRPRAAGHRHRRLRARARHEELGDHTPPRRARRARSSTSLREINIPSLVDDDSPRTAPVVVNNPAPRVITIPGQAPVQQAPGSRRPSAGSGAEPRGQHGQDDGQSAEQDAEAGQGRAGEGRRGGRGQEGRRRTPQRQRRRMRSKPPDAQGRGRQLACSRPSRCVPTPSLLSPDKAAVAARAWPRPMRSTARPRRRRPRLPQLGG